MATSTVVESARRALGPVGACLPVSFTSTPPVDEQRTAVRELERSGYRAAWANEVIGKDVFAQLSVLLAATERMAFGSCVANAWARPPQTAHGAAAYLAQAYPGRFALGLGIGYPQQALSVGRDFGSPLAGLREYVSGMDGADRPPAPNTAYPRILGATGPKMLALAGEISDGALPAGLPPEHTARARRLLGPDALLVVGQFVVLEDDQEQAWASAREVVANWSANPTFRAVLAGLGYPAEEITRPSDRAVAAIVALGGPDGVAARVREHLAAGADHVTLLPPPGIEFAHGIDRLVQVAPALAGLA